MEKTIELLQHAPKILDKAQKLGLITPLIARKIDFFMQNPKSGDRQLPPILADIREEAIKTAKTPDEADKIIERYKYDHQVFLREYCALLIEETQSFLGNLNPVAAIATVRASENSAIIMLSEPYRAVIAGLYKLYQGNYTNHLGQAYGTLKTALIENGYVKKEETLNLQTENTILDYQNQPLELEKANLIRPNTVLNLLFHAIKQPFMQIASLGMVFLMLFSIFPTVIIQSILKENTWLYGLLVVVMLIIFYNSLKKAREAAAADHQNRLKNAYLLMKNHAEAVIAKDVKTFQDNATQVFNNNMGLIAANNAAKTERLESLHALKLEVEVLL